MTEEDAPLTVEWMVREYGFDCAEVEDWVQNLHFNWPMSVKATDGKGKMIGCTASKHTDTGSVGVRQSFTATPRVCTTNWSCRVKTGRPSRRRGRVDGG